MNSEQPLRTEAPANLYDPNAESILKNPGELDWRLGRFRVTLYCDWRKDLGLTVVNVSFDRRYGVRAANAEVFNLGISLEWEAAEKERES